MPRRFMIIQSGIILASLCCVTKTVCGQGLTASLTGSIELREAASCTLTAGDDLSFGTVSLPQSGTGTITIDPVTEAVTVTTVTAPSKPSVGTATLTPSNVNNATVTVTSPPNEFSHSTESDVVGYELAWAQSTKPGADYSTITSTSYTAANPEELYFRIGGEASGIDHTDATGTYTATINLTATCM